MAKPDDNDTPEKRFLAEYRIYHGMKKMGGNVDVRQIPDQVTTWGLRYRDMVSDIIPETHYSRFFNHLLGEVPAFVEIGDIKHVATAWMRSLSMPEIKSITVETAELLRTFRFYAEESDILDRKKRLIERVCFQAESNQLPSFFGKSPSEAFPILLAILKQDYNGQSGIDESDIERIKKTKEAAIEEMRQARLKLNKEHGRELTDQEFRKIYFGRLLFNIGKMPERGEAKPS